MLAEAAGQLSAVTPSGAIRSIMPGLSNLGPEGHPHAHQQPQQQPEQQQQQQQQQQRQAGSKTSAAAKPPDQQLPAATTLTTATAAAAAEEVAPSGSINSNNSDAVWAVRMTQKAAGWAIGLGTAAFLVLYQWIVEPAAPGSAPVRCFTWLASGPLRPLMLAFYANASDFSRRLTSVSGVG